MTEDLVAHLGYVGFFLVLVLGGLGLPVPEEVPILLAAVLSRKGTMWWPLAFASCLVGVIVGDFVVYFIGYFYGEKVLSFKMTRKFLTKQRETQIKGYFRRHGVKILILGRFAVGFRTAAYLTAGILKLPAFGLFMTDLFAATFSTTLMFSIGWLFAFQIEKATERISHWQGVITWCIALAVASWMLHRFYKFYKGRRKGGVLVGPPVLVDDPPLPIDDLHSGTFSTKLAPPNSKESSEKTQELPASPPEADRNGHDEKSGELGVCVEFETSATAGSDLNESQIDPIRDP